VDPRDDARLKLAAHRHPSTPSTGSLHFAQHHLRDVVGAFVVLMESAGFPGAQPIPPPGGRGQWPRGHQARHTMGWPVLVTADSPFDEWLDTAGTWWRLRFDDDGFLLDAHPLGSPIALANELTRYSDALEDLLRAYDLT